MSDVTTLTGPDLTEGVESQTLVEGVPVLGHAGGEPVMLVKTQGEILAVGASCTHYGGPLHEGLIVGHTVRCPWHHACFSLRTGAVERAPALKAIACYEVEVSGTRVRVGDRMGPLASPAPGPNVSHPGRIVIVGAGAAGHAAAERLRTLGYTGKIALLGLDQAAPYDRPNLSKDFLAGTAPEDWIPLRPRAYYAERGIALETGVEVSQIDPVNHSVNLVDGRQVSFDRLLLAMGADPISLTVPGGDAPFVHMLRTLQDCRRLIDAAASARRVVVIGSGFIGLEATAALRARGLDVTVVSPDAEPLARVVGTEVGAFLRRVHEEHGVVFQMGQTAAAVEPGAVVTATGLRLPTDLVLVAIGVRPHVSVVSRAGIAVEGGVVVDEYLETSVPGIFAAGDMARFPDPRSGNRIRVEHWVVAQRMGATAAANMLGLRRRFDEVQFFWSVHYDLTLSYVGHVEGAFDITIDGRLDQRDCRVSYKQGGRLAAVLTIGRDHESLDAERALELATPMMAV
jgi:NADPH-dependent 2,4-dienoyl-CoA reductase/sulfur reductase-like enzyme/nitrite reductase/ring-hydroxylating ferredoxin subunit